MEAGTLNMLAHKCVTVSRRKGFGDNDVQRDLDPAVMALLPRLKQLHDDVEALRDLPSQGAGPLRYLLLIATECWEAVEALIEEVTSLHRSEDDPPADFTPSAVHYNSQGKPEGPGPEIADIQIRLLDFCGRFDVPLGNLVQVKHQYNMTRPRLHGRVSE